MLRVEVDVLRKLELPVGRDALVVEEEDVVVGGVVIRRELDGDGRVHFGGGDQVEQVLNFPGGILGEQCGDVVKFRIW